MSAMADTTPLHTTPLHLVLPEATVTVDHLETMAPHPAIIAHILTPGRCIMNHHTTAVATTTAGGLVSHMYVFHDSISYSILTFCIAFNRATLGTRTPDRTIIPKLSAINSVAGSAEATAIMTLDDSSTLMLEQVAPSIDPEDPYTASDKRRYTRHSGHVLSPEVAA